MKTIFKYGIDPHNPRVRLPIGAKIISAGAQKEIRDNEEYHGIFIWAEVDTDQEEDLEHIFEVFGTGHDMGTDTQLLTFIDTVFFAEFVFHVYEVRA